jgi:hypothetical protein
VSDALKADSASGDRAAVGFVMRLAHALHTYGMTAPTLDDILVKVSARLGLK